MANEVINHKAERKLLGKIWLLLGVVNEKLGRKNSARTFYHRVKSITSSLQQHGEEKIQIDEIVIDQLPLGNRIINHKKESTKKVLLGNSLSK